ncbi:uncharacterized protein LOC114525399 [Dendronephthya gigantea]|uniref:uncharacterized protein LOC114525399 n=1 Tax=Dendronephthya gigantea TaxID=151771 RepID=UPI00106A40E4|nr:uncharacterized protein LOC114525399 [Dendronephthya gigantea]
MTRRVCTKIIFLFLCLCVVTYVFISRKISSPRQNTRWSEISPNFLKNSKPFYAVVNWIVKQTTSVNTLETTKPSNTWFLKTPRTLSKEPPENVIAGERNSEVVRNETTRRRSLKALYGEGCKNNKVQKDFPTLMRYWSIITTRRKIKNYFICFGSLLGSWLHGQAIPYDHDLDICIFRKDLPKLDPEEAQRPFNYSDGDPHLIIQRSTRPSVIGQRSVLRCFCAC